MKRWCEMTLSVACAATSMLGCDKLGGGSALEVSHTSVPATKLEIKSGHTFATTKTFSWPDGKGGFAKAQASSVTVYVSNQQLDASRGTISMGVVPTSPGGLTVSFSLIGKDGTAGSQIDAAPEAGTYTAKSEKFMKVESVAIFSQTAGKPIWLDRDKLDGSVEVKSASGGKVEGSIDVSDGAGKIKGRFSATLGEGAKPK